MQVSILGPLIVCAEGRNVTPSAPKLRRVLSLLAIWANRVVRSDEIMEELWEDRPPLSATTTLQTYIYQIRKMLQMRGGYGVTKGLSSTEFARMATQTGAMLYTCPNGYVLSLPEQALDVHRFTELAVHGASQLSSGQVATAASTLRAALACWSGSALDDVDAGPKLQAEALCLEEQRTSVLEQRIEADFHLGRHRELVSELTGLVTRQPMHEGFQAKLMLALYRSGRCSDALDTYRRLRHMFATELGLEPSADLQLLHNSMISGDPALGGSGDGGLGMRISDARQVEVSVYLPPERPNIVGADAELAAVRAALARPVGSASPVVVAVGAPGSGKTAFGVHAAHQVRDDYPDGQVYARLITEDAELVDLGAVLAGFLHALRACDDERMPGGMEARCQLFRSWTASRKVLVVLDDVVTTEQLTRLLPSGPGCATIATARCRLADPVVSATIELRPWSVTRAMCMISNIVDRNRLDRDPKASKRLIHLCHGSPQALYTVAHQLERRPHWTVERLVQRLLSAQAHASPRAVGGPLVDELGLGTSLMTSYRLLSNAAQLAFRLLQAARQQLVSAIDTAAVLGVDERSAEELLEGLVEFQLAEVEELPLDGTMVFGYRSRVPST